MLYLFRITRAVSSHLNWIAGGCMATMMCLTCADIVGRLFAYPVPGAYDIMGFLGAAAVGLALPQTTIDRGHIAVELVVVRLPLSAQKAIFFLGRILLLLLFLLIAWEAWMYGDDMRVSGEVSLTIQIPYYPLLYGIAFASSMLCIVFFLDIFRPLVTYGDLWEPWESEIYR